MVFPLAGFATSLLSGAGGGLLGGLLSGGGKTGFGQALQRSLDAKTQSLQRGVENFSNFGGQFFDSFRQVAPVFGALETRVLGDLNDETRGNRLEAAFQQRLGQQQAGRGVFRSRTSGLNSAIAGVQFQEQIRQQAFGNAMSFQQNLSQPLATGFFQAGLPNIQGDIGFQERALQIGRQQSRNQSIASGLSQGLNFGFGVAGRAGLFGKGDGG